MANKSVKEVRFTKVGSIMKKNVVSIEGKQTVADAVKMMRENKVSSLLVNRRGKEDAWGIVTRKDVVNKIVDPGKNPENVRVFEIMSKPLVMVSPGLTIKYCARLFNQSGIRRAPVFDGKEVIGIVSNTDIFNALID
jgi:CBS domain-containing protein